MKFSTARWHSPKTFEKRKQRAIFEEQEDCSLVILGDRSEVCSPVTWDYTPNLSFIGDTEQVQFL